MNFSLKSMRWRWPTAAGGLVACAILIGGGRLIIGNDMPSTSGNNESSRVSGLKYLVVKQPDSTLADSGSAKDARAVGGDFETLYRRERTLVMRQIEMSQRRGDSYGRAFTEMHLDEDRIGLLRKLILASAASAEKMNEDLRRGMYGTRRDAEAAYDVIFAEIEIRIKALLTPEQYARFRSACEEVPIRSDVSGFNSSLRAGGKELTDEEFEKLVDISYRSYRSNGITPDLSMIYAMNDEADINRYIAAREAAHREIIQRAATFLRPDHIDVLRDFMTTQIKAASEIGRVSNPK